MKINKYVLMIIIAFIVLSIIGILFAKGTINFNDNKKDNNEAETTNPEKTVLYTYKSGDNNASAGDPEILKVYSMNDTILEFNYHAIWNDSDVKGSANKTDDNKYVYENGNYKIEFIFNDDQYDLVEVTEYSDGELYSHINLSK